jgi:hypothetical protein
MGPLSRVEPRCPMPHLPRYPPACPTLTPGFPFLGSFFSQQNPDVQLHSMIRKDEGFCSASS